MWLRDRLLMRYLLCVDIVWRKEREECVNRVSQNVNYKAASCVLSSSVMYNKLAVSKSFLRLLRVFQESTESYNDLIIVIWCNKVLQLPSYI